MVEASQRVGFQSWCSRRLVSAFPAWQNKTTCHENFGEISFLLLSPLILLVLGSPDWLRRAPTNTMLADDSFICKEKIGLQPAAAYNTDQQTATNLGGECGPAEPTEHWRGS
ncbi:hypothetical protein CapIbe_003805 [Capra ibex]